MGQVPCYGIIGNGRVARHMRHYLTQQGLAWRDGEGDLTLVLVADSAIAQVSESIPGLKVHFSGSQLVEGCYAAHPLFTFAEELYPAEHYQEIPFIVDEDAPEYPLPGLGNPIYRIEKSQRALYHAFCVLAGNFSCILWERLFKGFESELGLPRTAAYPYLQQITDNLRSGNAALTGPLVRGDWDTVRSNLDALQDDAFADVYRAFVTAWRKDEQSTVSLS